MPLAIGLSMLVTAALGTTAMASTTLQAPAIMHSIPQAQTVRQYVTSYFADIPIMITIAECESHFRQYEPDGSVYLGQIDDEDTGVMQINEHYHAAEAKALGLDLTTIEGNVAFARYLYEKEGTAPWLSSGKCWTPQVASVTDHSGTLADTASK